MSMKKYAICGVSQRAIKMFALPILDTFSHCAELVALLDIDPVRKEVFDSTVKKPVDLPFFTPEEFSSMLEKTRPDCLIVAGRDCTHAEYILKGLEAGIDVMVEKPMSTTAEDSRKILEAEKKSKGRVIVTFNYRYAPHHQKIKELVLGGKIGRVTHVDLNWYIDTYHGASYFKRWNRMREFSGGLSIHKSSHHFDLVRWWIDQEPTEAFAYGALNFFGPDGPENPRKVDGRHCTSCPDVEDCSYVMRWSARSSVATPEDDHLSLMSGRTNKYTGYSPDSCIFDSEINIEDTYVATVKYDKGAFLSYSVGFSVPFEGYQLAINGTKGRIESREYHSAKRVPFEVPKQTIDYFPMFGSKEVINVVEKEGGHGGGDPVLLEDLFLGPSKNRPFDTLSNARDGALAVTTGEAVWRSAREGKPIPIDL